MTPLSQCFLYDEVPTEHHCVTARQLLPVLAGLGGKRELQHVVQKQIGDTKYEPAASLMLGQKKHWSSNIVTETILYHFNSLILVVLLVKQKSLMNLW